jgi:tRNA threonylcarbamoyladenosine modification (KEOPS) complex  Pcc1 subunit
MLAGLLDIQIEQGATFNLVFLYQDENGDAIDMTGMTARMQLRRTYNSPSPLLSLTTENGRIAINVAQGSITLNVSAEDTATLTGSGVYDLELVNTTIVNRILEGSYSVCAEVTK